MKALIFAFVAVLAVLCVPVSSVSVSLCDKYAGALHLTGQDLVYGLVNTTLQNLTAPGGPLTLYFNGTKPIDSTDFTTDEVSYSILLEHVADFFGIALGCDNSSWTAAVYPVGEDLDIAHRDLGITAAQFYYFNKVIIDIAAFFGVQAADLVTINNTLNGLYSQIVFRGYSLCDKYSDFLGLTNMDFMGFFVNAVVTNVTAAGAPTRKYFACDAPCSGHPDFFNDSVALAGLVEHLIEFFGGSGALNCTDPDFPIYDDLDMFDAHDGLNIIQADFNYFVAAVTDIAKSNGVVEYLGVQALLNSFATDIVVPNPPSAPVAPVAAPKGPAAPSTPKSGTGLAASVVLVAGGLFLALA